MRATVFALFAGAAALAVTARTARAEDGLPFDLRAPARAGFAYTGISRGPAFELSWGVEIELVRLTKRLSFHALLDLDSVTRVDLPADQRNSAMSGIGGGAGLFYLTDGGVAFGFDAVTYATFDAKDISGAGFGAHAYVYPFYQRAEDSLKHKGGLVASYIESAISIFVYGRVDWTAAGNGGTLAFGVGIDLVRALFMPYADLLTGRWRHREEVE